MIYEHTDKKPHRKKNKRIRELRDMKQEALAQAVSMSQQATSMIENSETVVDAKLVDIAKALGVSIEAIKNFSEEAAINFFNNFYDQSFTNSQGATFGTNIGTSNPLEKLMETVEENKKLYGRLLQTEKEKVALLEKLLNK